MKKILFVGAPGSGKSYLSTELFLSLKKENRKVKLLNEYAREFIEKHGAPTNPYLQYHIYKTQSDRESLTYDDLEYLIIDAGKLSSYFYCVLYGDMSDPHHRLIVKDMYENFVDGIYENSYDRIFYVPIPAQNPLPEIIDDGIRFQNSTEIEQLDNHIRLLFSQVHRIPQFVELSDDYQTRLGDVRASLGI